jgi:transposase
LRFEQAAHHLVLEDYIQAVEAAAARRDRLTAHIAAMLPKWTVAPVVAALQTMRGMALVNAVTVDCKATITFSRNHFLVNSA